MGRIVVRFSVFSHTDDILTRPLSPQRHIIGVKAISSEGPEVSARETEADGVFDKLDVIKDKLVNLHGEIGKGESIVTTSGFRLPLVWWGARHRLCASLVRPSGSPGTSGQRQSGWHNGRFGNLLA
jgi:hypothetical protein